MDKSIELKPTFMEREVWPLTLGAANLGLCAEIVLSYSYSEVSIYVTIAKATVIAASFPLALWCRSKAPTWLLRASESGVHQQRYINGLQTVIESVTWDQVASFDQSNMIFYDLSGQKIMELSSLRGRSKNDKSAFVGFAIHAIESRRG